KAKATVLAAKSKPREVDIDLDPELKQRYTNDVPVILVSGEEAFRHRLDWQVVDDHHLEREFKFKDFAEALAFTNKVGAIAEQHNHHPDILLGWGRVKVT